MASDRPIDQVLLDAIGDEIRRRLPDKRCYYHYNPNAVIKGPILYFNWCSDDEHHWGYHAQRAKEVQILLYDGKIFITRTASPAPSLKT